MTSYERGVPLLKPRSYFETVLNREMTVYRTPRLILNSLNGHRYTSLSEDIFMFYQFLITPVAKPC